MKIHLHKNAKTTPAQREYIQNHTDLTTTRIAAQLGVSETTVRRWKNRSSVMDRPHTPRTLHTAMTPAQELTAILLRLTLRCGLDDLLAIMRKFIFPGCSRSGLNRCLKRYGIARLPAIPRRLGIDLNDYKGTHLYHTQIHLPGMPVTQTPVVMDILLDCSFKCINARFSSQTGRSSLPFVQKIISEFPFTVLGVIHETPVHIGEPCQPDSLRRNRQMLAHFCHIRKIGYSEADLIPREAEDRLRQTWSAIAAEPPVPSPVTPGQLEKKLTQALEAYHAMPLRTLRQASPCQALFAHHRKFPSCFQKKPTNPMGPESGMAPPAENRHPFCLFIE